jgi:hypothetical protein
MATTRDRLQEKWESITPRERGMVVLLGIAFVVCVLGWLALQISDGLTAMEKRNAETRKALNAMADFKARGGNKQEGVEVTIGDEPISIETYIDSIAKPLGIDVPGYGARSETTKGTFRVFTTKIELKEVTLDLLKELLEKLETNNKLVVISELKIRRNFRDKEKLDVDMSVSTFAKAKPAAGEGSASATGTAPAGQGK